MIFFKKEQKTRYVGWASYKRRIDFLNEFYFEQARIAQQAK